MSGYDELIYPLAPKKQSELILRKYSPLQFVCITREINSEIIFPVTVCFFVAERERYGQ